MTTKTISSTYASGYTLAARYDGLSITVSGLVESPVGASVNGGPGGDAGVALTMPLGGALDSAGRIVGGNGGDALTAGGQYVGGAGGDGVLLSAIGSITNYGSVAGGGGGMGSPWLSVAPLGRIGGGGVGGNGVTLAKGGQVTNTGLVLGGVGGGAYHEYGVAQPGGQGGSGVAVSSVGSVTNSGKINGGAGGYGSSGWEKGYDAFGGGAGGTGGDGIALAGGGLVTNGGAISGGGGGAGGLLDPGGNGGVGVHLGTDGAVNNSGTVDGGSGGKGGPGAVTTYQFYHYDVFAGGAGGSGADGVLLSHGGRLTNSGVVSGGTGGAGGYGANGGAGGAGVALAAGGDIENLGTIAGGAGGKGGIGGLVPSYGPPPGSAGPGGDGIAASGVTTITNGSASISAALIYGAVGIYLAGPGTVTNFGTIASSYGANGTAIKFTRSSDVLVEEATGVLTGAVVAFGGGQLDLGAMAGAGTISGLGSSIDGFKHITVDAGAGWHFVGANTIDTTLTTYSAVNVDGKLTNDGVIRANKVINLTTNSELFNHSTLDLLGDVGISPVSGATGTSIDNIGLLKKLTGTGVSAIRVNLINSNAISVGIGTLDIAGTVNTIGGNVSGMGTVELGGGATMISGASISVAALEIMGVGTSVTVAEDLVDTRAFSATGQTVITIDGGDQLRLGGLTSFTGDTIDGAGHLQTHGPTNISGVTLGGTAEWINAGTLNATGRLTLGDASNGMVRFFNEATGVFDLTDNAGIAVATTGATLFTNAGLLEKTGGTGVSLIATKVLNSGTISVTSGTLDLAGMVSGGSLDIGGGSTLEFGSTVAASSKANFLSPGGVLRLDNAAAFKASVSGFGAGETIDLRSFVWGSYGYQGSSTSGTLTVTGHSVKYGAQALKIVLFGQYSTANFKAVGDGHGGTDITFVATPRSTPALATPI